MTTPTFLWPVPGYYGVSSGFNDARGYGLHNAIDIPAPKGTPIVAVAAGRVAFLGWAGDCGMAVFIDHAEGWRSHYCHLSTWQVAPGQTVTQGQRIGYVGASGAALGPHLHLNLFAPAALPGSRYVAWVNKYAVDPLPYLTKEDDMPTLQELTDRVSRLEKRTAYDIHAAAIAGRAVALAGAGRIDSAQSTLNELEALVKTMRTALSTGHITP